MGANEVQLIVITGLSGAGKATAARVFEDLAFNVIDNLPPHLLPQLVHEFRSGARAAKTPKLAVVVDARSGPLLADLPDSLDELVRKKFDPHVLFLESSDAVLVHRFKETRRPHPLFNANGGILAGIEAERIALQRIRERASNVIDTSGMNPQELRNTIYNTYSDSDKNARLTVTVEAFGFKYGVPLDADLVFDVRFLKNPHYIDELRPFDGRDKKIDDYVMSDPDSRPYLDKLFGLIEFSLPRYIEEGKAYLTIAIGCTGGQHRSVVVAERLAVFIRDKGYYVLVHHRDLAKP
ncbi:MAG: RNase adapter RapZ [Capsulimonadaceae bacterium]|nr:RNase adapter RapZ [Capsulimonadaceae bacterium]